MFNKLGTVILFLFLLSSCSSSYNVIHVEEDNKPENSEGIYYALPRNVVTIDITVEEVSRISGPYAAYASKFLGIKDAVLHNTKLFELSDIKINTYSEPDPKHYYFVDLSNYKGYGAQDMMMSMSMSGLIQDLNDNSDLQIEKEKNEKQDKNDIDYSKTFKYFADANLVEKIDTVVEQVIMDTVTVERMHLKRSFVEKSYEQKAKEASELLMKIKEQRLDIITGAQEIAYSGATVAYMAEELAKMEQEYMKLFTGVTQRNTFHFRYYYLPESHVYSASIPLFKFSKTEGILKDEAMDGLMVYIHVDRARTTTTLEKFIGNSENDKESDKGLYYRIPESAKFTIKEGSELKAEASFLIGQFGVVTNLPAKNVKVQFYPNGGAIRRVQIVN
ncbi:MAG: hypothetical protein B6I18_04710 [Bacteroidetes bacterium 4572_112]|nr:MAG: hypothetical protein B6I18_04710 [Bacteroidetes bacterium 4572_112]